MQKILNLLLLGLLLLPARSLAQTTVSPTVTSPAAGALAGDNLSVVVNASSTYQIQSVTAAVADRTTNLLYTLNVGWTGTLSLTGLSRGAQTLIVTAMDVYSNSGQTQVSFVHDSPPVLTVLEPSSLSYDITASAFTRPALRARASASDDDPVGAVIQLYTGDGGFWSTVLATATNTMDTVVDLSASDGSFVPLTFVAKDSAGQITKVPTGAYVIANPNVIEQDRVSGNILDVSKSNTLFSPAPGVLTIKSRLTGIETELVNNPGFNFSPGLASTALTPHGAIFAASGKLYEVRDGTMIDLGAYQENLVVKGNYAIWIDWDLGTGQTKLMLRDLSAGTNIVVSTTAINNHNDVAPNGDVFFSGANGSDYQIYRYRNGITTQLGRGIAPRTDGVNVGYLAGTNMVLFDGTNTITLGPGNLTDGTDTLVLNNGWAGFLLQENGAYQVWTRSPAGVLSQRTFFGASSSLLGLGANGDLMVQAPTGFYYVTSVGSALNLGKWHFGPSPFWQEGNWYAALGESLLKFLLQSSVSISQPGWTTNGQFSFHISANIDQQVIVQESTNLVNWLSVSTNNVSGTNGVQATVSAPRGSDKKFYRLISAQ